MITYEIWEMIRLTEKLRTGGYWFLVRLQDDRVTGYLQRHDDRVMRYDGLDLSSVPFGTEGHTPQDLAWLNTHREHFRRNSRR